MTDHPFKPILLDLLHQAHRDQDAFLQELNTAERAAIGTPEYWSAKDHVAHMTFWRQRLVLRLQAIIQKVPQPESENFELLNPVIFEEQRYHPWPDILSESDHVYAELITLSAQLTEEDLTTFNRFAWNPNREPLYTAFMGNWYEHTQQHLAQYYLDRHDLPRAIRTYEVWARRVVEAEVPEVLKGIVLYNLACFYATHTQLEKASATLQQSLLLAPHLKEWSLSDLDLVVLRHQSA
jgi:tetratricopeptide (TPR) repeat protein